MTGNHRIYISDLSALQAFAGALSGALESGDIVALGGTLGAGKTTLAQLICQALGVTEPVTSPTFTLLNEYEAGDVKVLHGDLYRLTPPEIDPFLDQVESALLCPRCLLLMEWAELAPAFAQTATWTLTLDTNPAQESARWITIAGQDPVRLAQVLKQVPCA